ncbi:hypothetical protein PR048_024583 [Dryococelus australis]|uniref:Uncharacterized protein n=1 Tax=Dryococelus australis TaxID=614101 RepID=A0ABQ9GP23_9NEOP|nr:hypothetical protein PR048_024583 [Dryococelus australis]
MFQSLRASDNDGHKQLAEIVLKSATTADNLFGTVAEQYCLRSTSLPCVDGFIVILQQRFGQNKDFLSALEILLPKHAHENCVKELKKLNLYFEEQTSQAAVEAEYLS